MHSFVVTLQQEQLRLFVKYLQRQAVSQRASNKVLHRPLNLRVAFTSTASADQLFIQFFESDFYPMVRFEVTIINQEGGLGRPLQACQCLFHTRGK